MKVSLIKYNLVSFNCRHKKTVVNLTGCIFFLFDMKLKDKRSIDSTWYYILRTHFTFKIFVEYFLTTYQQRYPRCLVKVIFLMQLFDILIQLSLLYSVKYYSEKFASIRGNPHFFYLTMITWSCSVVFFCTRDDSEYNSLWWVVFVVLVISSTLSTAWNYRIAWDFH